MVARLGKRRVLNRVVPRLLLLLRSLIKHYQIAPLKTPALKNRPARAKPLKFKRLETSRYRDHFGVRLKYRKSGGG
jgi:hypothetical protein